MKDNDIGIFLHRTAFSESSAVVSYFTRKNGFQKFLFLGAKKKNSQLYPLNIQELEYFMRPESDLGKLTQAKNAIPDLEISFHPIRSCLAFFIAEIIAKCLNHTEKDELLFGFLYSKVEELNSTNDLAHFPLRFLLEFSDLLGFHPQVEHLEPTTFHLDDGHFDRQNQAQRSVSGPPMQLILSILRGEKQIKSDLDSRREALDALLTFYRLHIEHFGKLKSKEILDALFHG